METASMRKIFALNAYWVGLSFMWNSLHVIILPAILLYFAPETQKNTYLGLLTFIGLIIAMVTQPISGALSDGWGSKWGRRRPLIALGTAFDFVFLVLLGWSGGILWIVIGYLGLQFSSNIAHGPAQGLLPDEVPPEQMGKASGIKNLMDMSGLIISSLLVGRLLTTETRHPVVAVSVVALVLAAGALVTLFGVREKASATLTTQLRVDIAAWIKSIVSDLGSHRQFTWLIVSRLFFLIGVYGTQTFAQYYIRDVLRVEDPIQVTGDLLAAIALALTAFSVAGGWLGDRFGHRSISYLASLIGAVGCISLLWAQTPAKLLVFGAFLGLGIGLFLTANWALANQLAPASQAGKFLGLTNLATAGAAAISRLLGPMIDVLNNASQGSWWGYTFLFLTGAICIMLSAIFLRKVATVIPRTIPL